MGDPLASIKPIDAAAIADLTDINIACANLTQPFDDVPEFDENDTEVDVGAGLAQDHAFIRRNTRKLFIDYRPNPDALLHLKTLPRDGQSLHGVICGKYAAWDLVPAMIERVGHNITELHIATLSYSKQNAADMLSMLDEGQIKRVSLLVSYYFKAQNRELYDSLVPSLRERGHRVLAMRTHAKLLLMKFARGGSYVWEGSANLRSCRNVEQFVLTRCRKLYLFHRSWIEHELLNRRDEDERDGTGEQ